MLVYSSRDLIPIRYTDSDLKSNRDSRKSNSRVLLISAQKVLF